MGLSLSPLAAHMSESKDTLEERIELSILGGLIGSTAVLLPARRRGLNIG